MTGDRLVRCRGLGQSRPCSNLVYVDESVRAEEIATPLPPGRYCVKCAREAGWRSPTEIVELGKRLLEAGLIGPRSKKVHPWDRPRREPAPVRVVADEPLLLLDDGLPPVVSRGRLLRPPP